jgi:hypothetical protein
MKAIKDNKVYTVDEKSAKEYLARGFDIFGDDGKLIERSPSSTVSRKEYDNLLAAYEALKAEKSAEKPAEDLPEKKGKGKSGGEPDVPKT